MHIECFKNNGIDYLRLAEGRYVGELGHQKKIIVKNIGPLSKYDDGKPDFLKRLREDFKNGKISFDGISYSSKVKVRQAFILDNEDNEISLKNIGYFILDKIFNDLGIRDILTKHKSNSKIEYDILGLTRLLVFGRLLYPKSKLATFYDKDNYLFNITTSDNEKDIYKVLDILNEKCEAIQNRMNTKIKQSSIGRNSDLMYYDVTNYYFEAMYGDDDIYKSDENGEQELDEKGKPIILKKGFRKRGVCKNHTPNPLVAMGLFIDNNGIPVKFNNFPGNTQDKTTFKEMIQTTFNDKSSERVIVVASSGNLAQENIYLLMNKGNGYVISKSVKKHWNTKPTKEEAFSLKDWTLDEKGYTYNLKNNEITFKSKSRIYERIVKDKEGNTLKIQEKQVIFWSKKHYDKELKQNEKFIEYLESCKENPDKLKDKQRKAQEFTKIIQTNPKTGEILKTKPLIILLDDKIEKYKETMGYYSIITSEINLDDSEIINRYHGLARIEDSFRVIKSDLSGRPIYVWTEEHIKAHFLICFITLTITRLIQHKVLKYLGKPTLSTDNWEQGITAYKLKEALKNYKACADEKGLCIFTKKSDDLKLIYNALGIKNKSEELTISALKSYKTKINKMVII